VKRTFFFTRLSEIRHLVTSKGTGKANALIGMNEKDLATFGRADVRVFKNQKYVFQRGKGRERPDLVSVVVETKKTKGGVPT